MTHARLVLVWTTALLVGCKGSGDEGSSTGTSGTSGTSSGATTMASTGSSTSTPTTSGATTGGGTPRPYCGQACMVDADCCFGPGTCPTDEYPHNARCDAAGVCQPPQCSNDEQCTLGGTQPNKGDRCDVANGVCYCESDDECTATTKGKCAGL